MNNSERMGQHLRNPTQGYPPACMHLHRDTRPTCMHPHRTPVLPACICMGTPVLPACIHMGTPVLPACICLGTPVLLACMHPQGEFFLTKSTGPAKSPGQVLGELPRGTQS